jgi:hypothetical protein
MAAVVLPLEQAVVAVFLRPIIDLENLMGPDVR